MNEQTTALPPLYKNNSTGIGWWKVEAITEAPQIGYEITYAKSEFGKPVRKFHPTVAKNIGRANQTTAVEQAVKEAKARWTKQLDKGYTVEKPEDGAVSTNTLGYMKPMLATPIDKVKPESIDWENAYVQPKLDGHRAMFKDGVLYSRQGKEIKLPHIIAAIKEAGLDHLHLDGEIYWHGRTLQEIGSLIKRPRAESEGLEYWIYDVVSNDPYIVRNEQLRTRLLGSSNLTLTQTYSVGNESQVKELHTEFKGLGYEGTILRHGTNGYESDKRSRNLLKVKDYDEAEFRIISGKLGVPYNSEGVEYKCCVYVCECEGGTFDVTAPGTMQEKDAAWYNLDDALSKMLTVKFWNLSKDGIPQQPVALRIRDDV